MKKISLKSLTAVLLIAALVSTMVMIHSTAASDDFKVTYKAVLDSLNGISGPAALTDAVTEAAADSYDNANTAFKALSESEKSELNKSYGDIANKLDACSRRAKIFTEGSFFVDFEADKDLLKYLASEKTNNKYTFTTVQHGTAIPEITETFIYENYGGELGFYVDGGSAKQNNYNDKGNFADTLTSRSNVNGTDAPPIISAQFGLYKNGDNVCLAAAGNYTDQPRLFSTTDSGAHGWSFASYGAPYKMNSDKTSVEVGKVFNVGEIVDEVYNPYTLTARVSYKAYDATYYYASLYFGSENGSYCDNYNLSGFADSRYTKETIATSVQLGISDYTGSSSNQVKRVKTLTVSYPEVLAVKCAEADAYANTLDVSKITASMADDINKYYSLSVACGDKEYITADNKAKLETAKKVIDYLIAHNSESITTAQDVDKLETNITDKDAVTALYNDVQQVIGLGLGGMFSEAQLAKIESMKNAIGLMGDDTAYDATKLVAAATGIAELNQKQIVNDIAFETSLERLENAVKALGNFSSAVSNSTALSQMRTAYDALVSSGEYTAVSNYTFTKTGKRYTNNDRQDWNSSKDTGVVSYINNPSLSAGINEISFTLPVNTYNNAANAFVYSYDGIDSEADLANISGIAFFARHEAGNRTSGDTFTIHKESAKASTTLIPQDTSYASSSIYSYGTDNYATRAQSNFLPADYSAAFSNNNNLVWYHSKENVEKATVSGSYLSTDLSAYLSEKGYSCLKPYDKMNVTMEYQGDANTVKGFNWYLIKISGTFVTSSTDFAEETVYCLLFTNGRITTAGVTHAAAVDPSTVLTNLSIKVNRTPNALTNGASVRLANVNAGGGIRFESTVNKELYDNLIASGLTVELGTIIVPYDYVGDKEITFDNFSTTGTAANKDKCLDIKRTMWQDEENGVYTAAMINIKSGNYGRKFAARGYMKVTDGNGYEQYFYSDFDETANVRSITEVAKAALDSGKYDDNAAAKAILNTYAGITG